MLTKYFKNAKWFYHAINLLDKLKMKSSFKKTVKNIVAYYNKINNSYKHWSIMIMIVKVMKCVKYDYEKIYEPSALAAAKNKTYVDPSYSKFKI